METARELLGTELSALVGESYERAYADMVRNIPPTLSGFADAKPCRALSHATCRSLTRRAAASPSGPCAAAD